MILMVFRYLFTPQILFVETSRLLKTHKAAFFGRNSPGPAGVGDEFGPKFEVTKERMAMAMPFAHKTKLVWPGRG